nr:apolipoprotein N-acyltransferase [Vibrio stylophorae]
MSKSTRIIHALLALLCGASATLAFAPYGIWPLAFFSVTAFFILINQRSAKSAALLGFFWGLGQFGTGISWVYHSIAKFGGLPLPAGIVIMLLLIAYLALYPALFAYLTNRFFNPQHCRPWLRYLIAMPLLWLLCDAIRGSLFTGFPWLYLGYSQIDSPLSAIAPVFGVQGITLAIILCASALAWSLKWRSLKPLTTLMVVAGVCALCWWGQPKWLKAGEQSYQVSMIQGNIPQHLKWQPQMRGITLMRYFELTRQHWDSDIIIWPEAALPVFETDVPEYLASVDSAARKNGVSVLTGIIDLRPNHGDIYNSILVLGDSEQDSYNYDTAQRYNKNHLVPFGEFVPFESLLRKLGPLFNLPMSSFNRGPRIQPNLIAHGLSMASALCYEIAFSGLVRSNVHANTGAILTLSNDAWFGNTIGPHQHLEIARMRALELGRPVLRATNTGITAAIDLNGQLMATLPQFKTQVLTTTIHPGVGATPFWKWGYRPLWIASILLTIWGLWQRRKQKKVLSQRQ